MDIFSAANVYLRQLGETRPRILELNSDIFTQGGPELKTLVEISGNRKSGKTFLLMQLMAKCLINCDVILINISHKIDYQVLGSLVQNAVKKANPNATGAQLQQICEKCFNSMEIINCFSSVNVRMALKALENHILFDNERISLVAIDGLCEFYWFDLPQNVRVRKHTYFMNILEEINKICKKFSVCCIYTVDSSFLKNSYEASRAISIDCKLQLKYLSNGTRMLNDQEIVIDECGIQLK